MRFPIILPATVVTHLAIGRKENPCVLKNCSGRKIQGESSKYEPLEEWRCIGDFLGFLNWKENLVVVTFKAQEPRRHCYSKGPRKLKMRNIGSMTFRIFDQLISHSKIWDSNALMEMKQTLGSLVSGVLQELNVKFYLFQKVLATQYSKFDQHHTPDLSL